MQKEWRHTFPKTLVDASFCWRVDVIFVSCHGIFLAIFDKNSVAHPYQTGSGFAMHFMLGVLFQPISPPKRCSSWFSRNLSLVMCFMPCGPCVANPKNYNEEASHTVDGRNPAPADIVNIPLFTGCYTSQVVQDFFHQQYQFWWLVMLVCGDYEVLILKTPTMKWFPSTYLGIYMPKFFIMSKKTKLFRYLKIEVLTSISCR